MRARRLRIVPLPDEHRACSRWTRDLIDPGGPIVVVATTAIGFRGWVEGARAEGLGSGRGACWTGWPGVGAALGARGPKWRGAIRGPPG